MRSAPIRLTKFESGVILIKHWYMHNYIRKDTYTETAYKEEKNLYISNIY